VTIEVVKRQEEFKMEIGTVCIKIAGRDSNKYCVVVEQLDNGYVLIDGQTRRKKCNMTHLEPTSKKANISKGASNADVVKALKELKIECIEKKEKTKKEQTKRPTKQKKVKPKAEKKEKPVEKKAKKTEEKVEKPKEERKTETKPEVKEEKPKVEEKKEPKVKEAPKTETPKEVKAEETPKKE